MIDFGPIQIVPNRTLHKMLAFLEARPRSYPEIIEHLGLTQPLSTTRRKKLNRQLSILQQHELAVKTERGSFRLTQAGAATLGALGPVILPGAPNVRIFAAADRGGASAPSRRERAA